MAHTFCVQHHHLRSEVHWIRRYVKQQQQQQIPVTQRSTHPHTRAYWTSLSSSRTKRAKVSRCGSVDSVSTDTSSYYCQLTLLRQMLCNSKRRGTDMHQVHFIFTPPLASTHLAPHRPTDRQSKACLCIGILCLGKSDLRAFLSTSSWSRRKVDGERHLADLLLDPNTASGPGQSSSAMWVLLLYKVEPFRESLRSDRHLLRSFCIRLR